MDEKEQIELEAKELAVHYIRGYLRSAACQAIKESASEFAKRALADWYRHHPIMDDGKDIEP